MSNNDDDFYRRVEQERLQQRRDFEQAEQEESGRDFCRARRFVRKEDTLLARALRQADAADTLVTLLGFTLAERIERLYDRLDRVESATAEALKASERKVRETRERLERLEALATTDRFGRRVYHTEDGQTAYYEDGTRVPANEFAAIQWRDKSPTWEERQAATQALGAAAAQRDDIVGYQQRVREGRQRLEDDPSAETADEVEAAIANMPPSVRERLEARNREPLSRSEPDASTPRGTAATRGFNAIADARADEARAPPAADDAPVLRRDTATNGLGGPT
jgi:hypothetical protein